MLKGNSMKWEGGRKSSNVDDRRSTSGDGKRGMPSMGTIMMIWPIIKPLFRTKLGWVIIGLGAAAYFAGFNPLSLITERNSSYAPVDQAKDDKNAAFISTVLASTEDIWKKELRGYSEPTVVLYRGSTQSGCGYASAQMGPFYCPTDQKVYLDLGFLMNWHIHIMHREILRKRMCLHTR